MKELTGRLKELGYLASASTNYANKQKQAVMEFQRNAGLQATGIVDWKTYCTIMYSIDAPLAGNN